MKQLNLIYQRMRHEETYERMRDTGFIGNQGAMHRLNTSNFTSLVIPLYLEQNRGLLERFQNLCGEFEALLKRFYPGVTPQFNLEAAHITVRSIVDYIRQDENALRKYLPYILPVVRKWLDRMGGETEIYLMGLFSNLHKNKGLSIGIRVYPTLPLIQIIRGEVANALYTPHHSLPLRPESQFHTTLTHATLMRIRDLKFPVSLEFILHFKEWLEQYDTLVFANISDLQLSDFRIRNGMSDKLLLFDEQRQKVGCEIDLSGQPAIAPGAENRTDYE